MILVRRLIGLVGLCEAGFRQNLRARLKVQNRLGTKKSIRCENKPPTIDPKTMSLKKIAQEPLQISIRGNSSN